MAGSVRADLAVPPKRAGEGQSTQRAAWDGRLRDYASARTSILSDTRLSPAQRESRLSELLEHRFDATERLRVDALARNDPLPPFE